MILVKGQSALTKLHLDLGDGNGLTGKTACMLRVLSKVSFPLFFFLSLAPVTMVGLIEALLNGWPSPVSSAGFSFFFFFL